MRKKLNSLKFAATMCKMIVTVLILFLNLGCVVKAAAGNDSTSMEVWGIESGEEILQEFLDNTEYIQETEYFQLAYANVHESELWKKRFLEFVGDKNTEEKWNNMSSYEILVYFNIYWDPYWDMTHSNISSEDELVEATPMISAMMKVENGEAYAVALEKVIRWQYRYFEQTGTLYNFFAEDGQKNAHLNQVEKNENGLTKEELAELEALKEELLEGEDIEKVTGISQEKYENTLINNVTKLIPWFIVLLLFGIIGVVVALYINQKKNNSNDK